ncbi:MAG: CDP-diacylglycerol--serine O-phosphatidyltransferase [Pseudomonadota bacterium]
MNIKVKNRLSRIKFRSRKVKPDLGKGIYILPNLFTTASLFAGFYSIISSIEGSFVASAAAIIVSGVFDFLDGKVARMTKTTSQFGVEYDSLADLAAFGVAPAILGYLWALQPFGRLGWVVGFLYMACGALRLARFNVYAGVKSQDYFQGLPIPGAAAMVATTVFLFSHLGQGGPIRHVSVLLLIFCLSFLMVSNFKYFSLKNPDLLRRKPFNTLVAAVLVLSLIAARPQVVLFLFMLAYVASGPLVSIMVYYKSRKEREERGLEAEETGGETRAGDPPGQS